MRKTRAAFVVSALAVIVARAGVLAEPGSPATQTAPSDEVVVLTSVDAVDLTGPLPLSLDSLEGVKLAFQTTGTMDARFWLHRESGNKGLAPQRGVWKLTGNSPHVPGYAWGGGNWAPCLYRMDLFGQDAMSWHKNLGKPVAGRFTRLEFDKPGPKDTLRVRNLVMYRGEDNAAPDAPEGLTAQAGDDGTRLSWKPTKDNVGVAWYVISRARGDEKFTKIAQTAVLEYTDKPPAAGTYRYRVLAVDYERNLGPWSKAVSVQAGKGFDPLGPTALVKDSLGYAEHVRAVHEAGVGKIKRGAILYHGDCLHYLDRTRNFAASLTGLLTYSSVNWSTIYSIKPCNPSARLVKELPKELELKPEFCVISAGLEDLHPKPFPEDEHLTPEDRKKAVDNVLEMVRMCEKQGTVAIVTTLTPFGHNAPKGSPEEELSDELAKMCQENKVPIARVFDLFRQAQEAGEDYKKLMFPVDTKSTQGWPRGYEYNPYTPSFELGITKRFIVVKETVDRVLFTLLDRPE